MDISAGVAAVLCTQAETRLQSTTTAKGRSALALEESRDVWGIGQQHPQALNAQIGKAEMAHFSEKKKGSFSRKLRVVRTGFRGVGMGRPSWATRDSGTH